MNALTEVTPPARTYRGETADARRQQRRVKLLEAALDCFASHGIARTTMRDICSQARLTDRYFYEAFRNTGDAYEAVYAWQKDLLLARILSAMADAPPTLIEQARSGLSAFYAFLREDPRRAHVLLIDGVNPCSQASNECVRQALGEYIPVIQAAALRIYPRIKRDFNVEMMARGLLGMAVQVGSVWARDGFEQPLQELLDHNLYAWRGLDQWVEDMIAAKKDAIQQPA
ncbi:MAG: TetR/AcrR family transcriptional regulator [Burkholderiales bacterium]|nr:TetR/AcrR family transcriptional regulator [Burkholderiales bacterium]MBH2017097.1 TetR/AcrR family transcriptional regulator [Burkholderiales bacterium]